MKRYLQNFISDFDDAPAGVVGCFLIVGMFLFIPIKALLSLLFPVQIAGTMSFTLLLGVMGTQGLFQAYYRESPPSLSDILASGQDGDLPASSNKSTFAMIIGLLMALFCFGAIILLWIRTFQVFFKP